MTLEPQQLREAHCWFGADRVPGDPGMTAFKREARYRQALWREQQGHDRGHHTVTRKDTSRSQVPNGSKLGPSAAEAGGNFLSDAIRRAVRERLSSPQDHETLDGRRLQGNLLSSMPLCFNLFGELHDDPSRAAAAARVLLPEAADGPAEVVFEWSPGRRDPRWTNDRTAFDVALLVGEQTSPRTIIGVETKYHEHAVLEKPSSRPGQEEHYRALAERSGAFRPGWEDAVLGTELRQVWRDHLLLLSMLQTPSEWARGRYVLVHPAGNTSFAQVAEAYRQVLRPDDTTFAAMTIESLLDADVLHDPDTARRFRERYVW